MDNSCSIAFKEWAAVCAALASGDQTLLIRKGGIHEGAEGFRVAHREFWMLPTQFHQSADGLVAGGERFLSVAQIWQPPAGKLILPLFARVTEVIEIKDESKLDTLPGKHVLSQSTLQQRFHYREPGIFVLKVKVFHQEPVHIIDDQPSYAGCKTWVELPSGLSTDKVQSRHQ
jgi:hypothetical protein